MNSRVGGYGHKISARKKQKSQKNSKFYDFLLGGGEVGKLMRSKNWSKSAVGPIQNWPQSLRTAISMILNSDSPMLIMWGRDKYTLFYNDAFIAIQEKKHPKAVGLSGKVVWKNMWKDVGSGIDSVFTNGKTISMKNLPLMLNRNDYQEKRYFDFTYSPIRGGSSDVLGVFCVCIENTEKLVFEEALKAEQQRLQEIFKQTPAAVAVLSGKEHRYTLANSFYQKITNRTLDQLIGKTLREVFPEIKGQGIYELFDKVYSTGKPFVANEFPVKFDRSGKGTIETGYFRFVLQPIKNQKNKVDSILIHAVEVTDQVEARKKVEESEEEFRNFADNIQNLAWTANPDGWIFWYNKQWYEYTGTNLSQMQGWGWKKVHHPDHIERVVKFVKKAWKKGATWELTFPLKGADGKYRWFLTRAYAVKDKKGKVKKWIGTNTDIDDRKSAEEILQYQKSLLKAQQEVSPLGILVVSKEGKMLTYNKRFAQIWKFPKRVMDSEIDSVALQAAKDQLIDPVAFINTVKKCYKDQIPNHEKLYFIDGRIFERFGSPVIGKNGIYYGYVWHFLDITEREKLMKQKDEFIGIVSHELKTPVTSVKGYAQVMHKRFIKAGDHESALLLEKMDNQLNKLGSLIGDLLDANKIEGGRLQFHNDWFDFNELVREVVENMQQTTTSHTISLKLGKKIRVNADRDRISQVIVNLISNAIKYSPQTEKIILKTTVSKQNVKLCVEDFGIGISKEKQERVFERFFRVSGEKQDTFPGMGLGLYISSEIIKRQGGRIWVEGEKGKGSIFCFSIPIKAAKA